ncbi:hypothetical protein D5S18_29260 [Nocardia panacis]|uniref:Uncharacterized protein n=1 Tax=Nocardia panacis TaxID=2340916 RepID=A0A3A4JUR7_9NOCA|nr:SAM-dependent methyltransferase [Nocardia panacis]RJO69965.1 hypothetical protein D5S18_29260 [Nocardia panacis]
MLAALPSSWIWAREFRPSRTPTPVVLRARDEIAAFLDGFEPVEPGLTYLSQWRPDPGDIVEIRDFDGWEGIGRI